MTRDEWLKLFGPQEGAAEARMWQAAQQKVELPALFHQVYCRAAATTAALARAAVVRGHLYLPARVGRPVKYRLWHIWVNGHCRTDAMRRVDPAQNGGMSFVRDIGHPTVIVDVSTTQARVTASVHPDSQLILPPGAAVQLRRMLLGACKHQPKGRYWWHSHQNATVHVEDADDLALQIMDLFRESVEIHGSARVSQ